jgi:3,4-dihydroxy-2-butanone 4-phosphate synthase
VTGVEEAVEAFAKGQIVVVVDDAARENEGDLIVAAEHITAETIAFFLQHTSGFICVACDADRIDSLELPLMVAHNTELFSTAFTVTVDAIGLTTTGISASDRAATIRQLANPTSRPGDFARPGHVHVLRAQHGGVLKRRGHTEAGVDLARMAGLQPAAAICEVVSADKLSMARTPELQRLANEYELPMISINDLAAHRRAASSTEIDLTTKAGSSHIWS